MRLFALTSPDRLSRNVRSGAFFRGVMMDPEHVVEHVTALVKDRSSPSDDPTELLQAALDLCRSAASLLEQDLEQCSSQ